MKKRTIAIMVVVGSLAVFVGCAAQENADQTFLELPSTWTVPPSNMPQASATRVPTQILLSATPQPTIDFSTPIPTPVVPDVFVHEGIPVPQPEEVIGVENADPLVELARWGYGGIQEILHTADGQLMLVQTDVGVYAYGVGTLDAVWRYIPDVSMWDIRLDEEGQILVQLEQEMIALLDAENGRVIDTYPGDMQLDQDSEEEPEHGLYFADGKIYRSSDNTVVRETWEPAVSPWLYLSGISPEGTYAVFLGDDGGLAVYRISDGEQVFFFNPPALTSMAFPHLAKPAELSGPGPDRFHTFVFNRSERYFIAANGRDQIFFFDLLQEELHVTVHGNGSRLLIPPYGDQVIYYDCDTIEFYAIPSGEREIGQNFGNCCAEILFSPGGTRIAQGSILWKTENGKFQMLPEDETVIGFSENGSYVYSIREEWWWVKRRTADLELNYQIYLNPKTELTEEGQYDYSSYYWTFGEHWVSNPDGTLVIGGWTGMPYLIWNTATGEIVTVGQGDSDYDRLAFSPNGQYLIDIDQGATQILERQPNGEYTRSKWIETWGQDIDFIGNEYFLVTDNSIRVYSLSTAELIKEFRLSDFIRAAAVSPDGRVVAAALASGDEVALLDFETGEVLKILDVSSWGVYSLAFSPDGRYLAVASSSGVIRLWGIMPEE